MISSNYIENPQMIILKLLLSHKTWRQRMQIIYE